jgi:hypothetical protein
LSLSRRCVAGHNKAELATSRPRIRQSGADVRLRKLDYTYHRASAGLISATGSETTMANLARWCVILAALVGAPAAPAQASDSAPEGPPVESQPPQSPQEAPMQPPPVQQRMAPAPYGAPRRGGGFRAACGFDAERLCAGVPPGGGRIIECLMSYRPRALSPPCRSFIAGRMGAGPGYGRGPGYGPGPSYDPGPAYGPGPGYGRDLGPGAGYGPGAGRNQNGGYPPPYGALPPGPPGSAGTPPPGGQPGNASSRARSTQKTAPGSSTTPSPPEAAPDSPAGAAPSPASPPAPPPANE